MFHTNDEKSCLFHCKLKYAYSKAGCIPWDYPQPPDIEGSAEWCNVSSTNVITNPIDAFERAMDSSEASASCNCKPNCEQIVYETQVTC